MIEIVGSQEENESDQAQRKAENEGKDGDDYELSLVVLVMSHAVARVARRC